MSGVIAASGFSSILAAEYLIQRIGEEAAQRANMPPSMWVEYLVGDQSLVAHFRFVNPITGTTTATENSALPTGTWNPTGVTITAGLDGMSVQVSKLMNSIEPAALAKIAQQAGTALARAIDSAACALFSSLTGGTVGTSGAALTATMILQANANLDANYADAVDGVYQGRLHPQAFFDLQKDVLSKNFGIAKVTVDAQNKSVINVSDTLIYKNALVPTINTAADYAGAIYNSEALGLAIAQVPTVEVLPIPQKASWAVDATVAFGVGVVRPTMGCLVQSGVTA